MFIRNTFALLALLVIGFSLTIAIAHPSDGYQPRALHPSYGQDNYGTKPEWGINELYFVRPYPNPDSLTDAEKYVLSGTTESEKQYGLGSWFDEIFTFICIYEAKTGNVPTEMNEQVLDVIFEDHSRTLAMLELVSSPISGNLPRLDREYFFPGDMYVRKLTNDEKQHFADLSPRWRMMWFDGVEPGSGENVVPITMISDVYYMRIYGENSEIMTRIIFNWQ